MKTVLVAGSKDLECSAETERTLARRLGAAVVLHPGWRLLTGGAKGSGAERGQGGVDYCAAMGARDALENPLREKELILTLHPREDRTDLFDIGSVMKSRARTTLARRFELVTRSDLAFFIEGHGGTAQLIEYFVASGKPLIPIACTGGESLVAWSADRYRRELLSLLGISEGSSVLRLIERGLGTIDVLCQSCIDLASNLLRPTCFVVMPFSLDYSDRLWNDILRPAIEDAGFVAVRGDEIQRAGQVLEDITVSLHDAEIVIGDITGSNPNVLYEIGYAHALQKRTILLHYAEKDSNWTRKLPFDISGMRILPFDVSNPEAAKKALSLAIRANVGKQITI
jgi:hypothetical protein